MPAGKCRSSAFLRDLFLKPSSMLSIGIVRLAIAESLLPIIQSLFPLLQSSRGRFALRRSVGFYDSCVKDLIATPVGSYARAHLNPCIANHLTGHPERIDRFQCKSRVWTCVISAVRYQSQGSDHRECRIVEDSDRQRRQRACYRVVIVFDSGELATKSYQRLIVGQPTVFRFHPLFY